MACAVALDGGSLVCKSNYGEDLSPAWTEPFVAVSVGVDHACGIRRDGVVACWGDNAYGQAPPPAPIVR
jgi:hypothetical protein